MAKLNLDMKKLLADVQARLFQHNEAKKELKLMMSNHLNEQFILAKNLKIGDYVNCFTQYSDDSSIGQKSFETIYGTKEKIVYIVVDKVGELMSTLVPIRSNGEADIYDKISTAEVLHIDYYNDSADLLGFELDSGYIESQILDVPFVPYALHRQKRQENLDRMKENSDSRVLKNHDIESLVAFAKTYAKDGATFYSAKRETIVVKPFEAPKPLLETSEVQLYRTIENGVYPKWFSKRHIDVTITSSKGVIKTYCCSLNHFYQQGTLPIMYSKPYVKAKKGLE